MDRTTYSITDMNGLTQMDTAVFSYFSNQNEMQEVTGAPGRSNRARKTAGAYSYQDMNGYTGKDDVSFSYTSMNGQ